MSTDLYAEDWAPDAALDADASGTQLRTWLDTLRARRAGLKREADKGLAPEEFARAQRLMESFDAAIAGLEQSWRRRHDR